MVSESTSSSSDATGVVAMLPSIFAGGVINATELSMALAQLAGAVNYIAPSASMFEEYRAGRFNIDSGDTAWLLTCCAFVLMMTIPGAAPLHHLTVCRE